VNEWGFGGEIKSWWDQAIAQHSEWGLSECHLEQTTEGSLKRADLTVDDDTHHPVLVVELRLPDHAHPDPYYVPNMEDAAQKAMSAGARWSATTDGSKFLLVDNQVPGPVVARSKSPIAIEESATRDTLDNPAIRLKIRQAWEHLLAEIAPVVTGRTAAPTASPDEQFVESLRALLARPVADIRNAVSQKKDNDTAFRDDLIKWMVEQQGWSHEWNRFEEEIERVAKVSAYVFTTRLLFYEALGRAQPALPTLAIPPGAVAAQGSVKALFESARTESDDYDTVFDFDHVCRYALISDTAVTGWQRVVQHLSSFRLDVIDYDVLGRLFERLIDPHERYKWGQHYTSPDVVDIMLSLGIPDGTGHIMDPALGGGTFLVRGYVRKRVLVQGQTHQARLAELAGCDQAAFAASIATVSLASRDLSFADNYPLIRAGSFFQRFPGKPFVEVPMRTAAGAPPVRTPIVLPKLKAVVCNPPYVGFDKIGADRQAEAEGALAHAGPDYPNKLKGRFNYHLFFWFHAATFLDHTGRLVFITSGEWMDSNYGAQLQAWLLNYTHIEVAIESLAEPWFTEARVGTVVTSARRLAAGEQTTGLKTRFITLRKPLRALYGCQQGESDAQHIAHVDGFRDRLLALDSEVGESDDFDWSVVDQAELYRLGER
jgi:hypothetical protein